MNTNITCRLAGLSHRPKEAKVTAVALKPGDPLQLEREPDNKFDRNAIRVWSFGVLLGYVPSSYAAGVAPDMDAGRDVRCTVHSPSVLREPPMLTIEVIR